MRHEIFLYRKEPTYPFKGLHGRIPIPSFKHGSTSSHSMFLQSRLYWGCADQAKMSVGTGKQNLTTMCGHNSTASRQEDKAE